MFHFSFLSPILQIQCPQSKQFTFTVTINSVQNVTRSMKKLIQSEYCEIFHKDLLHEKKKREKRSANVSNYWLRHSFTSCILNEANITFYFGLQEKFQFYLANNTHTHVLHPLF
jgi:hypothetical protein